ncbi:hypothetical protein PMAYCL1PPCAC_02060, partial [Pristionchus mayeri]
TILALIINIMDTIARVLHRLTNKFLKKRRQSLEPHAEVDGDALKRSPPPRLSMDDTVDKKDESPPSTPSHLRSMAMLRAATPVRTNGILVYEGEPTKEGDQQDGVSQAESCVDWEEWNEPALDIHVDSPSQFAISGGDDSTSVGYEEEEEREEPLEEHCKPVEFVFDDEYEEDDFSQEVEYMKDFPVQKKLNDEYYWHPTTMIADEEGCYWDESVGYSNPVFASPVPSPLAYPAICGYDEEALVKIAKRVMEDDEIAMREEKTKGKRTNATYTVLDISPSVSPSARPDTPTTLKEELEESDASEESESIGATGSSLITPSSVVVTIPEGARDEDNEWLRSLYAKSGLCHIIPDFMKVDPPKKTSQLDENSRSGTGWATSTPVMEPHSGVSFSPAFSSISAIGGAKGLQLDDSNRTFCSPRLDGSLLSVGGQTYNLDVSVRGRVALAKKGGDYFKIAF